MNKSEKGENEDDEQIYDPSRNLKSLPEQDTQFETTDTCEQTEKSDLI